MSIPSNFIPLEQRIINVDDNGTDTGASFTVAAPAGQGGDDCFVWNDGSNSCQVLVAATLALAEAVAADASAGGTAQVKVGSKVGVLLKLNGNRFIGAVCESAQTTTLYCMRGTGQ